MKERGTCAFRVSVRERGLVRKREARGSRFTKKLLVFFGSLEADFPFSRLDHHWIWMLERQNICRAGRARLGHRAPSPCARGSAGPPRPRRSPRSCPPGRPRRPCCAGKARWSPPSRPAPVSPRRSLIRCHLSRPHPCRTALRTETNHEGDEEAVSGASGNASGRGRSLRCRRALDGDLTTRASPAVAAGTANPQSPLLRSRRPDVSWWRRGRKSNRLSLLARNVPASSSGKPVCSWMMSNSDAKLYMPCVCETGWDCQLGSGTLASARGWGRPARPSSRSRDLFAIGGVSREIAMPYRVSETAQQVGVEGVIATDAGGDGLDGGHPIRLPRSRVPYRVDPRARAPRCVR